MVSVRPRATRAPARLCWLAMLALGAGCGRVGFDVVSSEWIFVDGDRATFDLGSYVEGTAALAWRDGRVQLAGSPPFDPAQEGVFVSRPFATGDDRAVWQTLSWVPSAQHGRALVDGGAGDVAPAEGGVSMADNLLLLHFDGAGALVDGSAVTDSSGRGHHGRIVLSSQGARPTDGVFDEGLDLDRDAWVSLDGTYFDYGTGDFTYSVWVKMFDCAASNDNRVALGGGGAGDTPHMWIGASCPDACPAGDGAHMNFLDETRRGPSLQACTGIRLDDGRWHHLAGVKQGHTAPAAVVRLFVDGLEVASDSFDFGATTFTYDGGELRLGSFNLSDPQYHTRIVVDEAAIWKRALGADEIAGVYRRGAVRLELQVRVCADGTCDTEPFLGPDGTSTSFFTVASLAGSGNLAPLGLVGPIAQYRARFTTSSATDSPGLVRVTLEASHP